MTHYDRPSESGSVVSTYKRSVSSKLTKIYEITWVSTLMKTRLRILFNFLLLT